MSLLRRFTPRKDISIELSVFGKTFVWMVTASVAMHSCDRTVTAIPMKSGDAVFFGFRVFIPETLKQVQGEEVYKKSHLEHFKFAQCKLHREVRIFD